MKQIEYFFITEVNNSEKMRKILNKYMTVLHYAGKNLILLSGADSGVSLRLLEKQVLVFGWCF